MRPSNVAGTPLRLLAHAAQLVRTALGVTQGSRSRSSAPAAVEIHLLYLLGGLERPTAGTLRVAGQQVGLTDPGRSPAIGAVWGPAPPGSA